VPLGGGTSLWLHGDTLVGSFSGGVRAPTSMPRNSLALLNSSALGTPTSACAHFVKTDPADPVHFGWFSPANRSEWYWPTVGLNLGRAGEAIVIAMRMYNAGSGLFPFAMAGMDVLRVVATPDAWAPTSWPAPALLGTLPIQRDNFTMACAAAFEQASGLVYLMGAAGPRQSALLARLPAADLAAGAFGALQFWMPGQQWAAPPADGSPPAAAALFDYMPSETTLTWHPAGFWFIAVTNTFIYGAQVGLRTAPAVTGPWSDFVPIYTIPAEMMAGGVFCYAAKGHPELSPAGAPEIVVSFMCNTPGGIPPLLARTDIYVPQLLRVAILR
jgi:hypothetical protein